MKKLILSLKLFLTFFRISLLTFGGPYVMISMIEKEAVIKNNWIIQDDFVNITSICQGFPGPLAVNVAVFCGYKICGFLGALFSLIGFITSPIIVVLIIASFFFKIQNNIYAQEVLKGISAAVPFIILSAALTFSKSLNKTIKEVIMIIIGLILLVVFNVNTALVVLLAIVYALLTFFYRKDVKK